jgi:hypothetical protein
MVSQIHGIPLEYISLNTSITNKNLDCPPDTMDPDMVDTVVAIVDSGVTVVTGDDLLIEEVTTNHALGTLFSIV